VTGAASPPLPAFAEDPSAEARRRRNIERWKRRSRQIHFFRRALPTAIAVIVISLAGWILLRGLLTRLGDLRNATSTIHMTNARFYGRDGNGRPYVLSAAEATRSDRDSQRIALARLHMTFDSGGAANQNSHISADHGVYREDDRILRLRDHVTMHDQTGNTFLTDQATVNTVTNAVEGRDHVQGSGPMGSVSSDSYAIYNKGETVVFRGHVHSQIKHR
jgi:lipopolysaccharide export system protein LptC